jgi:hypothetical protein
MNRFKPYIKVSIALLIPILSLVGILILSKDTDLESSPNYELVYASPGFQFSEDLPLAPVLDEKRSKLTFANTNLFERGLDPQEETAVYIYDFEEKKNTRLTVREVEELELDVVGEKTPDAYTVECIPQIDGFFPFIGVSQDCSQYQLAKDGQNRTLELTRIEDTLSSRPYQIQVYGWIEK